MDNKLLELIRILIKMDNLNILFVGDSGSGKIIVNISGLEIITTMKLIQMITLLYINTLKEQGISYYRNDVKTFCQTPT